MLRTSFLLLLTLSTAVANDAATLGELPLKTFGGAAWKAPSAQESPVLVFAFLGTECPLARLYGPRLQELQEEFSDRGVQIVGVNSNAQDSVTEVSGYVAKHGLQYTMLKDVGNRLADLYQAERTPEVVVLDAERKVRYQGRIDDQYLVGFSRTKPERRDLAVALEQLTTGQSVSPAKTDAIGCHIGRISEVQPTGEITWAKHVAPIIQKRCMECHREGEIAPFELSDYDSVKGWEETIVEVIDDNRMPPWYADPAHGTFRNDPRLTKDEKRLIRTWVDNGMPPGDLATVPTPPTFVKGWRMGQPDQVIHMSEEAFDVPAQGVVDYQYFSVDPGWTEDKYVVAAEARPDNVAVVHHIIAYVIEPGADPKRGRNRRMLVGYAPGSIPTYHDDHTAMLVKAGSRLIFEMHYTPNGVSQKDRSYIGLKFIEEDSVKRLLKGRMAATQRFTIPPFESDHKVMADSKVAGRDQWLLDMTPHMHLRGKAFRYEAIFPDGKRETLLNVPRYDFNWQLSYRLKEPRRLPRGTQIICTATYDNSEQNIVNPDPSKPIGWGDQSDEEMMIGFYTVVDSKPQDRGEE